MANKQEKTPREKARKATLAIIARLFGCIWLIYIIYQLIMQAKAGDTGISMPMAIAITVVFGLAAAALLFVSVKELLNGIKNHDYSSQKYYAEELAQQGLEYNEFGEIVPLGTTAAKKEAEANATAEEKGNKLLDAIGDNDVYCDDEFEYEVVDAEDGEDEE